MPSDRKPPDSIPPESTDSRRRRGAPRAISVIPAYVDAPDHGREIAVIRDISVLGGLIFTRAKFAIDDDLEVSLYISTDPKTVRTVKGRVKRIEKREGEGSELWPYQAGIEFDHPIEEHAEEINELTKRLEKEGLLKRR